VPQTSLMVALFGGPKALESTYCAPPGGTAFGRFTGQNGRVVTLSQHVAISGCPPPKPSVSSASLSGLARSKPVLRLALAHAAGGPKLKSFTVTLPRGLSLNVRERGHGLSVPGGKVVALHGGKLTVRLVRLANTV